MKIACLAWGSLVWDPRTLPRDGAFFSDGPELPIEFSRVSLDGRVTLVIDPSAPRLRTLWVRLTTSNIEAAIEALGRREKIEPAHRTEWVGHHVRGTTAPRSSDFAGLDSWLAAHSLDAAVWTALPSRAPNGELVTPGIETLLTHLESLSGESRRRAEQYVRRTPHAVRTPNRARFESALGWLPSDDA